MEYKNCRILQCLHLTNDCFEPQPHKQISPNQIKLVMHMTAHGGRIQVLSQALVRGSQILDVGKSYQRQRSDGTPLKIDLEA
jgi:hypothetical protein